MRPGPPAPVAGPARGGDGGAAPAVPPRRAEATPEQEQGHREAVEEQAGGLGRHQVGPADLHTPGSGSARPARPRAAEPPGDDYGFSAPPRPAGGQPVAHQDFGGGWGELAVGRQGNGWGAQAGSAERHIRPDQLVKPRKVPAEMCWRKAVYVCTGKLVNLGAGAAERQLRDQIARIRTNIPGNYHVGVVAMKGGVGKTRSTVGIGTAYRLYRSEPVLA